LTSGNVTGIKPPEICLTRVVSTARVQAAERKRMTETPPEDFSDPCECCEGGHFGSPDDNATCFYCTHTLSDHAEYTGPLGEAFRWTS
jgi:hypothetical protein